jgi:protein involved in polysaccharide export with SLBB domain
MDEMLQELELEIARLSSEEVRQSLSEEDLAAQAEFIDAQQMLIEKLQQSRATGRVIISLAPLAAFRGSSTDLSLEDGDALHIPKQMNTVNVMGSVYNPTAIIFDENNPELAYYLERTGGPTENADEDLIYVIRSDGTVVSKMRERSWWRRFENIELYPGDTVLVPEKLVRSDWMRDTKDITQILYQIATTAGVTAALF